MVENKLKNEIWIAFISYMIGFGVATIGWWLVT